MTGSEGMTTRSEANVEQAVPGFWVRNIEESVRFYTEGLGFRMTNRWVDEGKLRWCRLDLGGTAVMLQEFWKEGEHFNVPDGEVGIGVGVCFFCKDAVALWREFVSRGLSPKRPFVGNGLWVMEIHDPDGYKLYFESPTDVPEDTVFSDDL
jgi:catechol 2,3-dioxygenase-like lactoylglutathione lyase family enzyme